MNMPQRFLAKIIGYPLQQGNRDLHRSMGAPALLVIEQTLDGFFLEQYTIEGKYAGDTWHRTIAEAKHQAKYEFGNAFSEWISVPDDVKDVVAWGIAS